MRKATDNSAHHPLVGRSSWHGLIAILAAMMLVLALLGPRAVRADDSDPGGTPVAIDDPGNSVPTAGNAVVPGPTDTPITDGNSAGNGADQGNSADSGDPNVENEIVDQVPDPQGTPTVGEINDSLDADAPLQIESATDFTCAPSGGGTEAIAAGGELDYACSLTAAIRGQYVDPSVVDIPWTVSAAIDGGWTAQLAAVPVQTEDPIAWGDAGATSQLDQDSAIPDTVLVDASGEFDASLDLAFNLRLNRPNCDTDSQIATIDVEFGSVEIGADALSIGRAALQSVEATLTPDLTPLDGEPPTVSVQKAAIRSVPFALEDQFAHGTLTLIISNPVHQCSTWDVAISLDALDGETVPGDATLRSVGDPEGSGVVADPSHVNQSLSSPLVVSVVESGADPGSYTQIIGFDLAIPGQTSAGAYTATVETVVEPDGP